MTASPRPSADSARGVEAIRHALPADVERGPHAFAIDGVEPLAAFVPGDAFEVAEVLRIADEHGLVVVPQGSRTALALGRPLDRYDIALELRGLQRVVEYVPDDLTITVEAGMHLDALQAVLADHGQYLPVDPPPDDHVSVGGMLASGRSGAWRGHSPAARDLILGTQTALTNGDLTQSGGRVVKNVTGYDLHRLHTGALGAFGVITQATFKLAPLPAETRTVCLPATSLDQAGTLARRVWNASLAVRAISVLTAAAAATAELPEVSAVLVEAAGSGPAVERSLAELHTLGATNEAPAGAWAHLRRLAGDQRATVLRLGVPPTAIEATLRELEDAGLVAWAHVAAGAVLAHAAELDAATVERLRAAAVERGGFLQVESAPAQLRRTIDPFGTDQGGILRALKAQLDPNVTLNRGRWMEGT